MRVYSRYLLITIFFLLTFLFSANHVLADGIRLINYDGSNYSIEGSTNQSDGTNGECILEDYGNKYIDKACIITNGIFIFTWPA